MLVISRPWAQGRLIPPFFTRFTVGGQFMFQSLIPVNVSYGAHHGPWAAS